MRRSTIRTGFLIHKWTSINCTAFLPKLCLIGLPLIFRGEIDAWSDPAPALTALFDRAKFA